MRVETQMQNSKLKITTQNSELSEVIKELRGGGVVVAPTDTVYGLLVDSHSDRAVRKLMDFKERPAGKAISIFVSDLLMLEQYVGVTASQRVTLANLLPGSYTIVLPSRHKASRLLEAENGTLGVRLIDHPFIINLVQRFGRPVTATSANLSGQGPVYDVDNWITTLSQRKRDCIDMVVTWGKLPYNKPSTVIDLTQSRIKVIREGAGTMSNVKVQRSKITKSPEETKRVAKELLDSRFPILEKKPLVFILQGDLGVGKTIFVKGLGEALGIDDIISPTFVIYYDYDIEGNPNFKIPMSNQISNPKCKLIHVDLYNLKEEEEFEHLGIERYLQPGNIMAIEWGERAGKIFDKLKKKGEVVFVRMNYIAKAKRQIFIMQ